MQTDQCVSTEELQAEMGELDKQLWALEQRGVELERKLRDCKKGTPNYSYCHTVCINTNSVIGMFCVSVFRVRPLSIR